MKTSNIDGEFEDGSNRIAKFGNKECQTWQKGIFWPEMMPS
jgi:hypothetical protein